MGARGSVQTPPACSCDSVPPLTSFPLDIRLIEALLLYPYCAGTEPAAQTGAEIWRQASWRGGVVASSKLNVQVVGYSRSKLPIAMPWNRAAVSHFYLIECQIHAPNYLSEGLNG
jgi:hypothetical protein